MTVRDWFSPELWMEFGVAAGKLAIFGAFLALLWAVVNWVTHFDDHDQLFVQRNRSYLMQRCGLLLGQGVAMWPLLDSSGRLGFDFAWLVGGGVWVMVLLGLLWPVLNWVVGKGDMTNPDDVQERSLSIVRGSFFVAAGFVIAAALSGDAPSVVTGIVSTVVFTLLGLIALVLAYLVNGAVPQFDRLSQHLRSGNVAAAIIAGGFTIALGIVLNKAIAGDFTGWALSLVGFAVTLVVAMIGFYLVSWLMDKFIITSATLAQVVREDQQLPAVATAAMLVTVAAAVAALPV